MIVATVVLVFTLTDRRPHSPHLEGQWDADLHRYDYLERIEFYVQGQGEAQLGWDQHIHYEEAITYQVLSADTVEISYLGDHRRHPSRHIKFGIVHGDYRFEKGGHGGGTRIRCSRRVTFSEHPFPFDWPGPPVFYGSCVWD